jgi:hypothetical protein
MILGRNDLSRQRPMLEDIKTEMGPDRAQGTPAQYTARTRPLPRAPDDRAETTAHRLRARGFSYRRIAEELRIRYDLVSTWLSGQSTKPVLRPPQEFSAPEPPQEPARSLDSAAPHPPQVAALERRIADLLAGMMQQSRDSREREARLHEAIENERRAAAQREAQIVSELNNLRVTVEALVARAGLDAERSSSAPPLHFWQRRSVR